jgi:predicted ATP-dependent serine protease
MNVKDYAC